MKKIAILHGWTYSVELWKPFVKMLKDAGFEVEMLKIPGLTAKIDRPWTLEDYVQWLKNILEKDKRILMGHSNGGRIALATASKYPDLVKHLILINSAGIYHDNLSLRIKRSVFKNIAKAGKRITSSKKLRDLLYKIVGETDYRDAEENTAKTIVNLISSDLTSYLPKITIPTLVIWGEKDNHNQTPVSDAMLINRLIKNSKLRIVKYAKHSPQFTHPKEVLKLIKEELG
jgi:pimeloyl-ACP methyl ester carboxylesterase